MFHVEQLRDAESEDKLFHVEQFKMAGSHFVPRGTFLELTIARSALEQESSLRSGDQDWIIPDPADVR